jgi:hypothetical protein
VFHVIGNEGEAHLLLIGAGAAGIRAESEGCRRGQRERAVNSDAHLLGFRILRRGLLARPAVCRHRRDITAAADSPAGRGGIGCRNQAAA